jgi:hypothetical protein
MTDSNDDLWPDLTGEPTVKAPLLILREQAVKLGAKTSNIIEAEVTAYPTDDGQLYIRFTLKAPALNGYEYVLLSIRQPVDLYPVSLPETVSEDDWDGEKAKDEQEFKRYLEKLFKSERTKKIISSLIAQSK